MISTLSNEESKDGKRESKLLANDSCLALGCLKYFSVTHDKSQPDLILPVAEYFALTIDAITKALWLFARCIPMECNLLAPKISAFVALSVACLG